MNGNNPYSRQAAQYRKTQVETASPEEILIMLYDGAIRFLLVAQKGMAEKDIEKTHNNLIKAQNILLEFMSTLDMEVGGDIARNLYTLYEYLHHRLVQANIKKDPAMVNEVLEHLRALKATWEEAARLVRHEQQLEGEPSDHDPGAYSA